MPDYFAGSLTGEQRDRALKVLEDKRVEDRVRLGLPMPRVRGYGELRCGHSREAVFKDDNGVEVCRECTGEDG